MQPPEFIPGLELSRLFYEEAVRPVLDTRFPGLPHSAALIGTGSEILGYDTSRSTDHEWGPRLLLFLAADQYDTCAARLHDTLRHQLPARFRGYSAHFSARTESASRVPLDPAGGLIDHKVEVWTVPGFFRAQIGIDPDTDLQPLDWLVLPQQKLLEATAGRVYWDGLGTLEPARAKLAYYPHDVWLYLLANQWRRIGQQEPFVGRTGEVGDDLGSRLIAADLVRDLMRLAFLMERRYAPYNKWFGTAFARLACAPTLGPLLAGVLAAPDWPAREGSLVAAYEQVARLHNALALTPPLAAEVSYFHDRPFRVIGAERFVAALEAAIRDPAVRAIHARFGAVDQFVDSTDVLSNPAVYPRLRIMYS
jgi:hypothetical protein